MNMGHAPRSWYKDGKAWQQTDAAISPIREDETLWVLDCLRLSYSVCGLFGEVPLIKAVLPCQHVLNCSPSSSGSWAVAVFSV